MSSMSGAAAEARPLSYPRDREIANSIISKMAHALRKLAKSAARNPGEAISAHFACPLEVGDSVENFYVAACPRIPAVLGDILYADINEDDFRLVTLPICDLLRLALEPYIVGVGWIEVQQVPEGVVIRLRNAGKVEDGQEIRS
jgi:hypothetical protein